MRPKDQLFIMNRKDCLLVRHASGLMKLMLLMHMSWSQAFWTNMMQILWCMETTSYMTRMVSQSTLLLKKLENSECVRGPQEFPQQIWLTKFCKEKLRINWRTNWLNNKTSIFSQFPTYINMLSDCDQNEEQLCMFLGHLMCSILATYLSYKLQKNKGIIW